MYIERLTFIWSSIWFSLPWWRAKCSRRIQGGRTTIWLTQTTSYHRVAHRVEVYSSVYSPPITADLTQNQVMPISPVYIKSYCTMSVILSIVRVYAAIYSGVYAAIYSGQIFRWALVSMGAFTNACIQTPGTWWKQQIHLTSGIENNVLLGKGLQQQWSGKDLITLL